MSRMGVAALREDLDSTDSINTGGSATGRVSTSALGTAVDEQPSVGDATAISVASEEHHVSLSPRGLPPLILHWLRQRVSVVRPGVDKWAKLN